MLKTFNSLLFSIFVLFIFAVPVKAQSASEEMLEGEIVEVRSQMREAGNGEEFLYQVLTVDVTRGSLSGETIEVVNDTVSLANNLEYKEGDRVVVLYSQFDGNEIFYITDYVRRDGLLILFAVFVGLAIAIGGRWGASSLVGMAISFLIIFKFILPQILAGRDAVLVAILGSALIIPVTFSLSHGFKTKTWIASIGTVITLIITGLIAVLFAELTHLTGFATEEASFLQFELAGRINMKGLLLAGMIIASLGILDDITISQASIVAELKSANKKLKTKELFARAMNVGRDHIASLINTLVLVYTGASLPLLLLFINNPAPFAEVINLELIADEIVRTLVGSIGLILAVPITTAIAAYYYQSK